MVDVYFKGLRFLGLTIAGLAILAVVAYFSLAFGLICEFLTGGDLPLRTSRQTWIVTAKGALIPGVLAGLFVVAWLVDWVNDRMDGGSLMRRGTADKPTLDELECLNAWPEGTLGHQTDKDLIEVLKALCDRHGYGRIQQLVQGIHDIWRDPAAAKTWEKFQEQRLRLLEQDMKDAGL